MDFGRSFSYITEDADWLKKLGIAAGLLLASVILLGIPAIAVMGWMMEITKRVSTEDPEPLPGWENIGDFFMLGLKMMVIGFVWALPLLLVGGCLVGGGVLAAGQMNDTDAAAAIIVALNFCFGLIAFVYAILMGLLTGPVYGLLPETEEWTKLFNPMPSFQLLKGNFGGYLIALLGGGFIVSVLGSVGAIACGIGSFVGMAFGYAIMGHLMGQAYGVAKANADMLPEEVVVEE